MSVAFAHLVGYEGFFVFLLCGCFGVGFGVFERGFVVFAELVVFIASVEVFVGTAGG